MAVTIISPDLVRVEPDGLTADDILDFGAALIEEHGWRTDDSGNAEDGWSIHGAVGEAARRATDSHAKDSEASRPLRDEAARQVEATHGAPEFFVNDNATGPQMAVDAMRAAMTTAPGYGQPRPTATTPATEPTVEGQS